MSNQWMSAGGSAWLDAVLYDDAPPKADILLDGSTQGGQAKASNGELLSAFDQSQPPSVQQADRVQAGT